MNHNNMPGMELPAGNDSHKDDAATFGTHGMMLAGVETLYLSHLPMFMAPHNFQVILEVALEGDAANRLRDSRARFGANRLYTFNPEAFSIIELASVDAAKPARKSFKGDLFHGHFEKGGSLVAANVTVRVENVVHFETLGLDPAGPADLEYLLFGKGKEMFLAHWITGPPDFDQVLSVNIRGGLSDADILQGVHVIFPGKSNSPQTRIKPGTKLAGRGHITGAHQFLELQVEATAEIYFEVGELRQNATFQPTTEEKAAGFGK